MTKEDRMSKNTKPARKIVVPTLEQQKDAAAAQGDKAKVAALSKAEAKKTKAGELTVSDIARELKLSPKIARGKLRKAGQKAKVGRRPTYKRDSADHKRIVATLTAE